MKKKSFLVIIIIIIQLITGCTSDSIEVSNIAIVSGIGLDKMEDGKILVSVLIPVTRSAGFGGLLSAGSARTESTTLVSEKGEGVMDAYRRIEKKLSRRLFFSQNGGIFIGENLARDGISDVIDFLYRNPESHLRSYVFFTKGLAAKLLSMESKLERSIIEKFVKEEELEAGFKVNFKDFLNMINEEGEEGIAAQVMITPLDVSGSFDSITSGIDGAAVLYKYKLVGWLNSKESRGALWLRNEIQTGIITDIPDKKSNGVVGVKIVNANTKVNPILNGKQVEMEVKINIKGDIFENSSNLDLSNPETIHLIQGKVAEDINGTIQLALEKVQKHLKSDVFGFGTAVYRKHPKQWNNYYKGHWSEEFSKVKVKVICDVNIPNIGLQSKRLTPNYDKH